MGARVAGLLVLGQLFAACALAAEPAASRKVPVIPPQGEPIRVIIDSDAKNEVDDQWALALAILSPERFRIEGFVAAPYLHGGRESVERSAREIELVLKKAGMAGRWPVKRGSHPLQYPDVPSPSEGVDFIIEKAMASTPEDPLWVVGLGAATNIASAYLKEPRIADRVVVFWHFRTRWPDKCWNFNVFGDTHAARVVFRSNLPFVLFDTGTHLYCPLEESAANVRPCGELGRYLHDYRMTNKYFMGAKKGFFDLGDIAALVDPDLACWETTPCPDVDWDLTYRFDKTHGKILRCYDIDRDKTFELLYRKLRAAAGQDAPPKISVWYGTQQRFGHLGHPQRWINVLGSVRPADQVTSLVYRLNGSEPRRLSYREDHRRIRRDGDFNVELDRRELRPGANKLELIADAGPSGQIRQAVTIDYVAEERSWPLPYRIDWSQVTDIQDAVQVVDGRWELTSSGIRSVESYYDRVVAFGDDTWRDYEVTTTLTVHAVTPPDTSPNATGVTHAAIALRWPGHDPDGNQPSVKWYPLGATAEFRLGGRLSECRWRIFDGRQPRAEFHVESDRRRRLEYEQPYRMKHRVETLADDVSWYRVKLWPVGQPEPERWDLERREAGDLLSGSALLLAHHADVTFGNVSVVPLGDEE